MTKKPETVAAEKIPGVFISLGDDGVYPVYLRGDVILVNEDGWKWTNKWAIPLSAVSSLSWGRATHLFVNWEENGQFRQLGFDGRAQALDAFLARIRAVRPELTADEANRGWTDLQMLGAGAMALFVLGLPLLLYFLAKEYGWTKLP